MIIYLKGMNYGFPAAWANHSEDLETYEFPATKRGLRKMRPIKGDRISKDRR